MDDVAETGKVSVEDVSDLVEELIYVSEVGDDVVIVVDIDRVDEKEGEDAASYIPDMLVLAVD